jgi:hypothetical protein
VADGFEELRDGGHVEDCSRNGECVVASLARREFPSLGETRQRLQSRCVLAVRDAVSNQCESATLP